MNNFTKRPKITSTLCLLLLLAMLTASCQPLNPIRKFFSPTPHTTERDSSLYEPTQLSKTETDFTPIDEQSSQIKDEEAMKPNIPSRPKTEEITAELLDGAQLFRTDGLDPSYHPSTITIIRDAASLASYIVENESIYNFHTPNEQDQTFSNLGEVFDETFFTNYDLILVFQEVTSISLRPQLLNIEIDQDREKVVLEMQMTKPGAGEFGLAAKGGWHYVVPMVKLPLSAKVIINSPDSDTRRR